VFKNLIAAGIDPAALDSHGHQATLTGTVIKREACGSIHKANENQSVDAASCTVTPAGRTRSMLLTVLICGHVKKNDVEQVQALLDEKTTPLVEISDCDGRTPLHIAACHGTPLFWGAGAVLFVRAILFVMCDRQYHAPHDSAVLPAAHVWSSQH
jgi:hypothetical protein